MPAIAPAVSTILCFISAIWLGLLVFSSRALSDFKSSLSTAVLCWIFTSYKDPPLAAAVALPNKEPDTSNAAPTAIPVNAPSIAWVIASSRDISIPILESASMIYWAVFVTASDNASPPRFNPLFMAKDLTICLVIRSPEFFANILLLL